MPLLSSLGSIVNTTTIDNTFLYIPLIMSFCPFKTPYFCRYVISNACSKDLCYKQKGTDFVYQLGIGEHAHLHGTDTTRFLHIYLCLNCRSWT
jgi:hypothetical protein